MKGRVTAVGQVAALLFVGALGPWIGPRQAEAGIAGSVHDLWTRLDRFGDVDETVFGWDDRRGQACRACHMPREADRASYAGAGMRWSINSTAKTTWRMYGSDPSMLDWIDGRIEPAPTGSSKLCLGCHDGGTAVNQYDGRLTGVGSGGSGSSLAIGNTFASLINNHPISITYDQGKDSQLRDPSSAILSNGLSVKALLEDGRVECATCHDVHGDDAASGTPLLRPVNAGANLSGAGASSLCLLCHDK